MDFQNPRIRRPGGSMPPPPQVNPEILDVVLVRLPRDDPAGFIRASSVCKSWLFNLTDPAFLRRYRDLHGTAPLVLGFLRNGHRLAPFVPTTAFRVRPPAATDHRKCFMLDCRHGRALFYDCRSSEFVVWNPITGRERRMRGRDLPDCYSRHAVLCAAGPGCDHSACSEGPFLMASAGVECCDVVQADACVYSSETGERTGPDGIYLDYFPEKAWDENCPYDLEDGRAGVLVGGTLYFVCQSSALLRYDVLGRQVRGALSVIEPPPGEFPGSSTIVMTAENGGLGLATFRRDVLQLWSTKTGHDGDVKWVKMNRIHLRKLMHFKSPARLIGFVGDINVVFVRSDDHGIFTIELKSLLTKKVCEMDDKVVGDILPYLCYSTPAACARRMLPASVGPQ